MTRISNALSAMLLQWESPQEKMTRDELLNAGVNEQGLPLGFAAIQAQRLVVKCQPLLALSLGQIDPLVFVKLLTKLSARAEFYKYVSLQPIDTDDEDPPILCPPAQRYLEDFLARANAIDPQSLSAAELLTDFLLLERPLHNDVLKPLADNEDIATMPTGGS